MLATGGAIFKGVLRLAGTVLAGCLGVSCQYLVYLINGLSYDNTALKFVAMTVLLSLLSGALAAVGVRYPRYTCEWRAAGAAAALVVGVAVGPGGVP